jgi:cytochrome b subunit of formate dehydrogenase
MRRGGGLRNFFDRRAWGAASLALLGLGLLACPPACRAADPPASEDCLTCHSDPTLSGQDAAGRERAMSVDPAAFTTSVHGALGCTDCHGDVTSLEHAPDLAPVSCAACHADADAQVRASDHGRANAAAGARACTMCHGDPHQIRPASDPASATHRRRVPGVCAQCHEGAEAVDAGMAQPVGSYARTVHGRALLERDNLEAATCTDCHGSHAIDRPGNPASRLNRSRIQDTCGQCHGEIAATYSESIHGRAIGRGVMDAATCTDCHGEHTIRSPDDPASSVFATTISEVTCARCHAAERITEKFGLPAGRVSSYRDSYHGLASEAGERSVANCASCHGVHDILPASDPRSSVHVDRLPITCGQCHPGVSATTFRGLTIHSGPDGGVPLVRWVRGFYRMAIPLILGMMVLHHALDFGRKLRRHLAQESRRRFVRRWNRIERIEHVLLLVSFIALAYSGFAIKYPNAAWGQPFVWLGGEGFRSAFHRAFALVFFLLSLEHLVRAVATRRGRQLLRGMAFKLTDARAMRGFISGAAPELPEETAPGRFSYVAKAEYWALVWGGVVMTLTGAALVFNEWTLIHLPGWASDLATNIHWYEAVLATLAILIWHFYAVIFNPDVYPLDLAMFTGNAPGHPGGDEGGAPGGGGSPPHEGAPVRKRTHS